MVEILGIAVAFVNALVQLAVLMGLGEDVVTSLEDIATGLQAKIDEAE